MKVLILKKETKGFKLFDFINFLNSFNCGYILVRNVKDFLNENFNQIVSGLIWKDDFTKKGIKQIQKKSAKYNLRVFYISENFEDGEADHFKQINLGKCENAMLPILIKGEKNEKESGCGIG